MLTTYLLNSLQNSTPVSRENRKWTLVTPNVDLIFRSVCFLYCSGIVCLLWLFSILNFIHFESIFALKNFFPIAYDFTRYCSEWKGHFTEWRSSAGGRKKKKNTNKKEAEWERSCEKRSFKLGFEGGDGGVISERLRQTVPKFKDMTLDKPLLKVDSLNLRSPIGSPVPEALSVHTVNVTM